MEADAALVLLSGGQDSATCLAWALDRYARVETLGFSYGQRHLVELSCRAALRDGMAAGNAGWAARLRPGRPVLGRSRAGSSPGGCGERR